MNARKGRQRVRYETDLGELEEGGAGVEQAVDALPREQLPPRLVPPHRLRASPGQHLHMKPGVRGAATPIQ
ncbi:hypothetical protein OsJ_27366 [Oryza sativa Japonica Group]|uniref:Uncharacterized protein n=1 Tax=Oryza sativa subsp. japonica TaxID=39947 RepID=B9G0Z2_ORYSJ|nr:hypothetical protein OsJ_27366 [Oryza sativa Japonica Group]